MKIRCIENSIRLRLKKSDLEKLKREEKLYETVKFPALNLFTYGISITDDLSTIGAEFVAGVIIILLPKQTFLNWLNSTEISIEANIKYNRDHGLHILIEKDLPCNDRPEEDKSDTFEELVDQGRVC